MSDFYSKLSKDVDDNSISSEISNADPFEYAKKIKDDDILDTLSASKKSSTVNKSIPQKKKQDDVFDDMDADIDDILNDDEPVKKKPPAREIKEIKADNKPSPLLEDPKPKTFEPKPTPKAPAGRVGGPVVSFDDDDDVPLDFDDKKDSGKKAQSQASKPVEKPARSVLDNLLNDTTTFPSEKPRTSIDDFQSSLKQFNQTRKSSIGSKNDDLTFGSYRPSNATTAGRSPTGNEDVLSATLPSSKRAVHFDDFSQQQQQQQRPFTASGSDKFVSRFEETENKKPSQSKSPLNFDYLSLGNEIDLDLDDKPKESTTIGYKTTSDPFAQVTQNSPSGRRSSLVSGMKSPEDHKSARVTFDSSFDFLTPDSTPRPSTTPSARKSEEPKKRTLASNTLDDLLQQERIELSQSPSGSASSKPPVAPSSGRSRRQDENDEDSFFSSLTKPLASPASPASAAAPVNNERPTPPSQLLPQPTPFSQPSPIQFPQPVVYSAPIISMTAVQPHLTNSPNLMVNENKLKKIEMERSHLQNVIEMLKQSHKDEIEMLEQSYKQKLQIFEETHQRREERLREENELLSAQSLERLKTLENERGDIRNEINRRIEQADREKAKDIEKIREEYRITIDELRREHADAMERLKHTRAQELETLQESAPTTRSLRAVLEEMQSSARELSHWKNNVNNSQTATLEEREYHTKATEERLRVWEERLRRQEDENSRERIRLQDVVNKLENQLREQARQQEDSRWKAKDEQVRLSALQTSLEEERRSNMEHFLQERSQLEKLKQSTLAEQKVQLQQLYDERRSLAEERAQILLLQKQWEEKHRSETLRMNQSEVQYSGQHEFISEEKKRLTVEQKALVEEKERLTREKFAIEQERHQLQLEKDQQSLLSESLQGRLAQYEARRNEIETAERNAVEKLAQAKAIQDNHEQRLASIQESLKLLHEKEKALAKEKILLTREREEIHRRNITAVCSRCHTSMKGDSYDPLSQTATSGFHSTGNLAASSVYSTAGRDSVIDSTDDVLPVLRRAQELAMKMEQTNNLQKLRIDYDRDDLFLEEERRYLQSLRELKY